MQGKRAESKKTQKLWEVDQIQEKERRRRSKRAEKKSKIRE